jgi:ABC-type multidrug transport system fused ATPase/permease subunit
MWGEVALSSTTGTGVSLGARTRAVVRAEPMLGIGLAVGAALHAAGHAFLAGAAGLLAKSLAGMVTGSSTLGDDAVLLLAAGGVVAALSKLVGGAVAAGAEARIAGAVAADLRLAVLDRVLSVEESRSRRRAAPERLAALTTHVADVERGIALGVLGEVRSALVLLPLAILLVVLAPRLAGSAVLALGLFGLLAFALRRTFRRAHDRASRSASGLVGAADEAVRHAELWATYGAKRRVAEHVARASDAIARQTAGLRVSSALLSSTSEVLGALALVLVLLLAARGALGLERGTVVPFAIAFFMAYRPLRDLVDARLARLRGEAALRAAEDAVGRDAAESASSSSPASPSWTLERLTLERIRPAHGKAFELSLSVPPGAVVALVGPTGVGKTSLLRALLGLEGWRSGAVHYGDLSLEGRGVGPCERPFAWVPQDAPVVADTLAVNIGLGRADSARGSAGVDPAALLEQLGAGALASALAEGCVLGAGNGRALSGGERQWIAMARALATELPVLLLDEPTSSLDPAAEVHLLQAIARLRGRRTVLLVTHRPAPLAIADVVVRLEEEPAQRESGVESTVSEGPGTTSTALAR